MHMKNTPHPHRRARIFGYLLFTATLIACVSLIMYRYYLIDGWNLWYWIGTEDPYEWVIRDYMGQTVLILSLIAGFIASDKKTKAILLAVCYLYVILMVWIVPVIWHTDVDINSVKDILEAVIVYGSIFSLVIIPCFAISSFVAWCVKTLIHSLKNK